jgi:signal transduction histidine kinase
LNREKQINIIIEEADRLGSIVEDLLKLSQMEAGYSDITLEKFMLNQTLTRVVKRYELPSEKAKVQILQSATENILIIGDENKIEQVLYNLINNAFNHSTTGGAINISVTVVKDRVRIEIEDQGEGIPVEEIPYIWDRFYKVDKSGKREKAGTGLGLAIVKNILIAHKSSYGVRSSVGSGTTFWFDLMKAD